MLQTEQQKRKVVAELLHGAEKLKKCIEAKYADEHMLDLAWNLLRKYAKSRRLLKEFNAFAPDVMLETPRTSKGYRLNDEHAEHLAQAVQTFESRSYVLRHELTEMAENRLYRDLEAMNAWWKQCNAEERDIAFSTIAAVTGAKKPAKFVSLAKSEKRLMLLARGMEAIELVYREARRQSKEWNALSDVEQRQIKKSIHIHTGKTPDEWWNNVTITERNNVLGKLLDALDSSKKASPAHTKSGSSVA